MLKKIIKFLFPFFIITSCNFISVAFIPISKCLEMYPDRTKNINNIVNFDNKELKIFNENEKQLYSRAPRVLLNNNGVFIILWNSGISDHTFVQRYNNSEKIGGIVDFIDLSYGSPYHLELNLDNKDNFIVISNNFSVVTFNKLFSNGDILEGDIKLFNNVLQDIHTPKILIDKDGNYIISWLRNYTNKVYIQKFSNCGDKPISEEKEIIFNSLKKVDNYNISINNIGNVVIAAMDSETYCCTERRDAYATTFDKNFNSITKEFKLPGINLALNEGGNFTVVWSDNSDTKKILFQQYNLKGKSLFSEKIIEAKKLLNPEPIISMNKKGNFIIVWKGDDGIYANKFNKDGISISENFKVNISETKEFYKINSERTTIKSIDASLNDLGNFVIIWEYLKIENAEFNKKIFARAYNE